MILFAEALPPHAEAKQGDAEAKPPHVVTLQGKVKAMLLFFNSKGRWKEVVDSGNDLGFTP